MTDMVVYSSEQRQLIHETVAKGCSETEFALLMELAKRYELDPFQKQIWAVKYGSREAAIFCGRDGFLAIAHRSGQFDGMESGTRKDDDGEIVGFCRVWRRDMTRPFEVEVYMREYESSNNPLWKSKPRTMLQKVAESQALRRAFSVSGLYSPEEFDEPVQQRPMKDVTPKNDVLVCDTCGVSLRDDDKLAKIREHSNRDMCQVCFMEWYAQQQAGEQA